MHCSFTKGKEWLWTTLSSSININDGIIYAAAEKCKSFFAVFRVFFKDFRAKQGKFFRNRPFCSGF